jgi:hypothetical protein
LIALTVFLLLLPCALTGLAAITATLTLAALSTINVTTVATTVATTVIVNISLFSLLSRPAASRRTCLSRKDGQGCKHAMIAAAWSETSSAGASANVANMSWRSNSAS